MVKLTIEISAKISIWFKLAVFFANIRLSKPALWLVNNKPILKIKQLK